MVIIIGKEPMTCPMFVTPVHLGDPEQHLLTTPLDTPLPSTPGTLYGIAVH